MVVGDIIDQIQWIY